MDVFGLALSDQFNNDAAEILWLHNNYGEKEEMPVDVFFRTEDEMPELELHALKICKGKVLDAGAGVGSHSLILQKNGIDVTALEISETACSIMQNRGVKKVINQNIFLYQDEKYDTILFLMNGIGLAGDLQNLNRLLEHCLQLLNPGGQILFDSSDISYLYDDIPLPKTKYMGEISYCYEYKNIRAEWFNWLYISQNRMNSIARQTGWDFEVLYEDDHDQYLGRLKRNGAL